MTEGLWWPAPAKLNLFLHITGRRPDGYHELQSIFQFLDCCDYIHCEITDEPSIVRLTDVPGVPAESDLIVRAAQALQKRIGGQQGVRLSIKKTLPMGGGIGGGSSDAATVLLALNYLWDAQCSVDELADLGLTLGADVPVFVRGHTAWAEGVGEQLTAVDVPEPWYVVLHPEVSISTAVIFNDSELTRDSDAITIRDFLAGAGRNDCEPVVRCHYPAVAEALDWLDQHGKGRLTGTGSCVFSAFDTQEQAERVSQLASAKWQTSVAKGMNLSLMHQMLASLA